VKNGKNGQNGILFRQITPSRHLHPLADEIHIGQHDPLRGPRSPAAVEDYRQIFRVHGHFRDRRIGCRHDLPPPSYLRVCRHWGDLPALGQVKTDLFEQIEIIGNFCEDEDLQRCIVPYLPELAVKGVDGKSETAPADPEIKGNLLGGGKGMNHTGHGADLVGGIKADDTLRGGGHGNRNPVPFLQSQRIQCPGTSIDFGGKVAVSGGAAHEIIGDRLGIALRRSHQGLVHRHPRVVQGGRHGAVISQPASFVICCHVPPLHK